LVVLFLQRACRRRRARREWESRREQRMGAERRERAREALLGEGGSRRREVLEQAVTSMTVCYRHYAEEKRRRATQATPLVCSIGGAMTRKEYDTAMGREVTACTHTPCMSHTVQPYTMRTAPCTHTLVCTHTRYTQVTRAAVAWMDGWQHWFPLVLSAALEHEQQQTLQRAAYNAALMACVAEAVAAAVAAAAVQVSVKMRYLWAPMHLHPTLEVEVKREVIVSGEYMQRLQCRSQHGVQHGAGDGGEGGVGEGGVGEGGVGVGVGGGGGGEGEDDAEWRGGYYRLQVIGYCTHTTVLTLLPAAGDWLLHGQHSLA
jgi:hypothetical protein